MKNNRKNRKRIDRQAKKQLLSMLASGSILAFKKLRNATINKKGPTAYYAIQPQTPAKQLEIALKSIGATQEEYTVMQRRQCSLEQAREIMKGETVAEINGFKVVMPHVLAVVSEGSGVINPIN